MPLFRYGPEAPELPSTLADRTAEMPNARVLLKQGGDLYRLVKFSTSSDGSLLAFVDRDRRSKRGSLEMDDEGNYRPSSIVTDDPLPSGRLSIHTTGEVHRYQAAERKATIYIEPLYALTKLALVGFLSIPRVSRLDLSKATDKHEVAAVLEIPESITERLSFAIEIGPKPQQPASYGIALHYEHYSAVVRLVQSDVVPSDMVEHFVFGMPAVGVFRQRQVDPPAAELAFYHGIHGERPLIFRENEGSYIFLSDGPLRAPPHLIVTFDRPDLRIEPVPFGSSEQPTHKVRFWVFDKGGKNRRDDLRRHITSVSIARGRDVVLPLNR